MRTHIPAQLRNFNRDEYYDIFASHLAASEHEHSPSRGNEPAHFQQQTNNLPPAKHKTEIEHNQSHSYESNHQKPAVFNNSQEKHVYRNLSWDQSVQKPQDHYRAQNSSKLYNYTQSIEVSKEAGKKDRGYETVYRTQKMASSPRSKAGHIFNSGPLMDDKGGDSDIEDYFNEFG